MKVAVCFSGLPRFVRETYPYWQRCLFEPYDCDVFVHTWKTDFCVENIFSLYKPVALTCENPKTYDVSLYTERIWAYRTVPQNQIAQYTGIKKAIGLALDYQATKTINYDIVIRARFDWFLEKVDLEINDCVNLAHTPGLNGHRFQFLNQSHLGVNDQFGYGSPATMQIYSALVDNLPTLYSDYGVDFCGELFLKSHLLLNNVEVKEHRWKNGIVRWDGVIP